MAIKLLATPNKLLNISNVRISILANKYRGNYQNIVRSTSTQTENFRFDFVVNFTVSSGLTCGRMKTLEDVRVRSERFCEDREWHQFHTPTNLCLALQGEVGEVAEIFQWRGLNYDYSKMTPEDLTLTGEEISDVLIYCVRLSQQCNIDLGKCINSFIREGGVNKNEGPEIDDVRPDIPYGPWEFSAFETIESVLFLTETNPRFFVMKLGAQSGVLSNLFAARMESEVGLAEWQPSELKELGFTLASIAIILCSIAKVMRLNFGDCVQRKMTKNEIKYPVDKSRGSSRKYTSYQTKGGGFFGSYIVGTTIIFLGLAIGKRIKF